ncbi:oxidoreductase [Acidobacteria bacterium Mor1]|nr:oxidoreductase [Acidobacteria bacterium Mor1]
MKRTIVMTGVSRGLGRALAGEFVRAGHTVCGCARSAAALARLTEEHSGEHRFDRVDVTDDDQVRDWAESLASQGIVPDLLINNAALINRNARLWEVPPGEMDLVLRSNVLGTYHVIRHFLPAMIEAGRGVIVNFSSTWGRSTSPEVAPYCATKWAIEGMTQSLSQELPRGLAAVALNPGIIDTDMLRSCFGPSAASYSGPRRWAATAAPFLLELGPAENGCSLDAP